MMAHLQALIHGRLLDRSEETGRILPATFIAALNRDVCSRFEGSRYVTMLYAEFDSSDGTLCYINAGHCQPILIGHEGKVSKLTDGNVPVGLLEEASYQSHSTTVAKGSAIVVYTDGLTDALNTMGEPFGEERLLSVCKSMRRSASAQEIGAVIAEKVAEWSAGEEQFDDNTILVLSVA